MNRFRAYYCNSCNTYAVIPTKAESKHPYVCFKCGKKFTVIDKTVYQDGDGDLNSNTNTSTEMVDTLLDIIFAQEHFKEIVAAIPTATRHLYPENDVEAAIQFFLKNRSLFNG